MYTLRKYYVILKPALICLIRKVHIIGVLLVLSAGVIGVQGDAVALIGFPSLIIRFQI